MECKSCGDSHDDLKRCANCESAIYCSVECQKSDWIAGHADECTSIGVSIHIGTLSEAESQFRKLQSEQNAIVRLKGIKRISATKHFKSNVSAFLRSAEALQKKTHADSLQRIIDYAKEMMTDKIT